jgi:hypothetical protein
MPVETGIQGDEGAASRNQCTDSIYEPGIYPIFSFALLLLSLPVSTRFLIFEPAS